MNPNLTLLGQIITFGLFVWFTMKFVWPPVIQALAERQKKIADGLAAAERGVHELALAQQSVSDLLRDAKIQTAEIIEQANQYAVQLIDEAKGKAREEGQRLIQAAKVEIEQEVIKAKQQLKQQVANIVILGAERVLSRKIDVAANQDLLKTLIDEM